MRTRSASAVALALLLEAATAPAAAGRLAPTTRRRLDDCQDVFGNCAAYVAAGHTCEASFCSDCDWAGQCDAFCGVCGGECVDTYDHCQTFISTSEESCSDLFCADCSFSGYCDASCGLWADDCSTHYCSTFSGDAAPCASWACQTLTWG